MPERIAPFTHYLQSIDYMLIGIPRRKRAEIYQELRTHLEDAATERSLSTDDEQLQREVIDALGSSVDLGVEFHQAYYARYQIARRASDLIMATLLTLLMLPFFIVAALIIKLETPGPLFYKAEWLGQYGRCFMLYRLRTMTNAIDMEQRRFTRFGAWIRKLSLDESAALINVFKGELSFVGPRLLRPGETNLGDLRCRRILQVQPGMSSPSLARYGFERVSLPQQLDLDEAYLEQRSLRYDLRLFWETLRTIYHRAHREETESH
ncbi:sugar transferase [Ktedonospora formicarum]|uniref:Bacterial sugar transferase domain-containing protein n=1 Tax=Ktedonospora formicarum TaxID=2778364 RepID=A0A8J3IFE0_9CHLR|nr:sugar transferase [Ktedonospora formicarum]GHO50214.1 hypothetical protein KSX_83770 [Ktedonospora formicarum]